MYKLTLEQIYQIWRLGYRAHNIDQTWDRFEDDPTSFAFSVSHEGLPIPDQVFMDFAKQKTNELPKN